jgi:hypothetical protein
MNNNQFKNTLAVLSDLSGSLQKTGDELDLYFNQFKAGEMLNPLLPGGKINSIGSDEALPPEFFQRFGIRTLILDSLHGKLSLSEKSFIDIINKEADGWKWRELKSDLILEDLQMLFRNSQIVEFSNWPDLRNATEIWDNLRKDVIKPLKRKDFDFIFYLGDASMKLFFEVDEFLDILSDYSLHGRVTLVLDERAADNLWVKFCGLDSHAEISTLPGLREKCRSVFDLIHIGHLIVDSFPSALLFCKDLEFEIEAMKNSRAPKDGRNHYNDGYILGLLLKFEIFQSVALGMAVSGVYTETGDKPDSKMLFHYIEKWMEQIESFKPEGNKLSIA